MTNINIVQKFVNKYCKRDLKYVRTEAGKLEGEEQLGRHKCRWVETRGLDFEVGHPRCVSKLQYRVDNVVETQLFYR